MIHMTQKGPESGKAHTEFTAATDMYRDMEMTFWLEKAEESLAEAG